MKFFDKIKKPISSVARVPRRHHEPKDEIDRLLQKVRELDVDTDIIVPVLTVAAHGTDTEITMECASCSERCRSMIETKWLTAPRAPETIEWACASCGLRQKVSITNPVVSPPQ